MSHHEATCQREAIAEAMRLQLADDDDGTIHVYGEKLYGPPEPGEHHCDEQHPYDGAEDVVLVFHSRPRALGWTGGYFCMACGTHLAEDEQ